MNALEEKKASPQMISATIDMELLSDVQEGDTKAVELLMTKYEKIVYKKASVYYLIGSDRDDVVQEGLIGLYKAICDYDSTKRASFKSFAELCITRQIISSIKSATRLKHSPLNSYISIYKPASDEDSERTMIETIINDGTIEPMVWMEKKEHIEQIKYQLMKALTSLEWAVLALYTQGWSYEEISDKLKRSVKSIDNALQRIKRKVAQLIQKRSLQFI